MTREELWLAAIAGLEGAVPPDYPVWHYEEMLAAIYDAVTGAASPREFPARSWHLDEFLYAVYCAVAGLDDPGCPAPTCRIEEFWKGIHDAATGDDSASVPDPVWRIEEFLSGIFDVASGWGASVLTETGNAPLTLANAIARAIRSLTQTGLCTQSTTPTPDAPVDIMCNNGALQYGAVGKNLVNIKTADMEQGSIAASNGSNSNATYRVRTIGYYLVKPNTQYTLSCVIDGYTSGSSRGVFLLEYTTDDVSGYTGGSSGWKSPDGYTFTTGASTNFIRIVFSYGSSPSSLIIPEDVTNVQLEYGETATDYEPFVGGIYADGTPEVLTVRTNNLVDVAHLTPVNLAYSTNKLVTNTVRYGYYIPVKPNTKYTVSINRDKTNAYLNICESASEPANNVAVTNYTSMDGETASKTITMKSTTNWLYVYAGFPATPDPFTQGDFQIEEGNTATPYAPYHRETASVVDLLGLTDDYRDTQEIISGAITRKCGIKVFDGTEAWTADPVNDASGNKVFSTQFTDRAGGVTGLTLFCSHYEQAPAGSSSTLTTGKFLYKTSSTNKYVYFDGGTNLSITSWKAWLAAQYAAGTPVIVLYPLAEPTTESVAGQHLATAQGTNIVSVTAEVSPVALTCEYYGASS